jgi:hypothetical protein
MSLSLSESLAPLTVNCAVSRFSFASNSRVFSLRAAAPISARMPERAVNCACRSCSRAVCPVCRMSSTSSAFSYAVSATLTRAAMAAFTDLALSARPTTPSSIFCRSGVHFCETILPICATSLSASAQSWMEATCWATSAAACVVLTRSMRACCIMSSLSAVSSIWNCAICCLKGAMAASCAVRCFCSANWACAIGEFSRRASSKAVMKERFESSSFWAGRK